MADESSSAAPAAWLIRAGSRGEYEDYNLENGVTSIDWGVADLAGASSREDIVSIVRSKFPGNTKHQIAATAGQLWTFSARVRRGDLVVMPRKQTSQLALGIVTGEYRYGDGPGHTVPVDWKRTDVPRTAVQQDLLYSLGALMTICSISRNDAVWRLHQLLLTGRDPGARVGPSAEASGAAAAATAIDDKRRDETTGYDQDDDDSLESRRDLERLGLDQIQAFIAEKFAGHKLSRLVAEVLEAEGFFTQVSPPGPDGGIDVFAGQGTLGLDSPRLVVQVKSSPTPVDVKIVRELNGVLTTHGAEQALLVAWGGVNNAAHRELRNQFFRLRVWDADDLLRAVLRNYNNLSEDLRADLPLKRIWSLVDD